MQQQFVGTSASTSTATTTTHTHWTMRISASTLFCCPQQLPFNLPSQSDHTVLFTKLCAIISKSASVQFILRARHQRILEAADFLLHCTTPSSLSPNQLSPTSPLITIQIHMVCQIHRGSTILSQFYLVYGRFFHGFQLKSLCCLRVISLSTDHVKQIQCHPQLKRQYCIS